MTPAARIQAAIDLVGDIETSLQPGGAAADRIVSRYFRARRFAGAGDRATITDLVYLVLRQRGRLFWLLGEAGDGDPLSARGLILAALVHPRDMAVADVAGLFTGEGYGPAHLDDRERLLLDRLAAVSAGGKEMPRWARLNYPEWLDAPLAARFGDDLEAELGALNQRAPLDLRVNTLKTSREAAADALATLGAAAEMCPLSPLGLRLAARRPVADSAPFRAGEVEPQDEGAQIAAALVDARSGMQVVDLCAGAGGKTLALAAAMKNGGQIHAFDRDRGKCRALRSRIQRAGVRNTQVLGHPGANKLAALEGKADRVLLDVPCGGSGTWRRNPHLRWRYGADSLAGFGSRQTKLLTTGAGLVKPGGRLVYVTCSVLGAENEERIGDFLTARGDFVLLPFADVWKSALATALPDSAATLSECLQLTPLRHGTDGFFVAILERLDSVPSDR
ncbi:MAG: RsmB/NOP family class I SAM-dependent RNA methyltransferase [Alphaproteobacteria bacterium]